MAKVTEQSVVKQFGWHRLGKMDCEQEVPLSDAEKMELGHSQGASICEIARLEEELASIKKDFKHKIEGFRQIIEPAAEMLRTGTKKIVRTLPAFFDPDTNEKKFIDLDTGEEVSSMPATESDRQLMI